MGRVYELVGLGVHRGGWGLEVAVVENLWGVGWVVVWRWALKGWRV